MSYFLIQTNEEGVVFIEKLTAEEFLRRLNTGEYGEDLEFLDTIPRTNVRLWGDGLLLIKGEIIVPQPKTVVQEYSLE